MKSNNPWDLLSDYFNTSKTTEKIPSRVADNIYIAWPVFLKFISTYLPNTKHKKALDYGCGGGSFAHQLFQLGFTVIGIDSSKEMIRVAQRAYGKQITFCAGDVDLLQKIKPFDIITSVMTLQFIEDIEKTISALSQALVTNGLIIFAVYNPDFVKESIKNNRYLYYDSANNPTKVKLRFQSTIDVPIYIRTVDKYNALAQKYKLKLQLEEYPPFTQEFIEKYP
ncbi:class I SAM-dependent methyltransferase, partial [Candidatus Daviesbacteria bacterium]|nr:class I SAM-dependent methyltransferase [Candidatus Daviesbacteria bacterium]